MYFYGACSAMFSGGFVAPPELDALALGDEEKVVAQGVYVLIVEGHDAEAAVAVCPDERRQVPCHRGLRCHPPGVGEPQSPLYEIEDHVPPLVGRHLEVTGK